MVCSTAGVGHTSIACMFLECWQERVEGEHSVVQKRTSPCMYFNSHHSKDYKDEQGMHWGCEKHASKRTPQNKQLPKGTFFFLILVSVANCSHLFNEVPRDAEKMPILFCMCEPMETLVKW